MCQRNLRVNMPLIIGVAIAAVLGLLVLLGGASRFRSRVQAWQMSPDVVLKATQELVAKNPALHNPVGFSAPEQTTVDHWDAYRWRVSGYVDCQPEAGQRVRTLYFAVVQSVGSQWRLEDLQLQNIESGLGKGK